MSHLILRSLAGAALLLPLAGFAADAPKRLSAPPSETIAAPATISNEAPVERVIIGPQQRHPECQMQIGGQWINERAASLEACAALLEAKAPRSAKNMSTAYWNNLHLAVDDKTVYHADAKSDWKVLRPRAP